MIAEVETLEAEPVVGRYYRVKCVKHRPTGYLMPILGPQHEDAEFINFPALHWHIDFRFVTDSVMERLAGHIPEQRRIFAAIVCEPSYQTDTVVTRRRRCQRAMPTNYPFSHAPWLPLLEAAHADRHLCAGRICPHRGIPLRGVPADPDGIVVCPGHGLSWNTNTGALHRRCPH